MLEHVISGGQTGADQAAWRAAKVAGIPTGGAMPKGFKTEDGNHPEFATEFGAHEVESGDYPARTKANIEAADGTICLGDPHSPGGLFTRGWCQKVGKPYLVVPLEGETVCPSQVAKWIDDQRIRVLKVAGTRESKAPGIGVRVEAFLARVFALTQKQGENVGSS